MKAIIILEGSEQDVIEASRKVALVLGQEPVSYEWNEILLLDQEKDIIQTAFEEDLENICDKES